MAYHAGQGTIIRRGTAAGASLPAPGSDTFSQILKVRPIKLPSDVQTTKSFKVLESAAPLSVGGALEENELSFRIVWDPADAVHVALRADAKNSSSTAKRRNWQVVMSDSGAYTFDYVGFVSKWEWEDIENENEVAANITVTLDGAYSEAA